MFDTNLIIKSMIIKVLSTYSSHKVSLNLVFTNDSWVNSVCKCYHLIIENIPLLNKCDALGPALPLILHNNLSETSFNHFQNNYLPQISPRANRSSPCCAWNTTVISPKGPGSLSGSMSCGFRSLATDSTSSFCPAWVRLFDKSLRRCNSNLRFLILTLTELGPCGILEVFFQQVDQRTITKYPEKEFVRTYALFIKSCLQSCIIKDDKK